MKKNALILNLSLLLSLATLLMAPAFALSNQMADAPSPYLQQHAQDKVHWQVWSPESLALAKQARKPILLSIGYFACHWCHVMQQESYQNQAVAEQLNRHFIPIKVDRELAPALDQAMLGYAKSLLGVAGWPLNIYLTPDARPFDAHVYLDAQKLLARLQNNRQPTEATSMPRLRQNLPTTTNNRLNNELFVQAVHAQIDELNGGFIGTRKFPQTPQLLAIAGYLRHYPDRKLQLWLEHSLTQMATMGLNDQVNGGFFRYTVDSEWRMPHFEKMLVDNALLWQTYELMAQQQATAPWSIIADQTLDFMLKHLYDKNSGAFYTSLSALDALGNEGGHYLWSREQLKQHLSPFQLKAIEADWQLKYPPSFDLGYLPIWAEAIRPNTTRNEIATLLRQARANIDIATDRKRLISYNGLMLAVFSQQLKHRPELKPIAQKLVVFITQAWQKGVLSQGYFAQKTLAEADLEGYAFAAKGLLDYALAAGDVDARDLAIALLQRSRDLFVTDEGFIAQLPIEGFSLPRQAAFSDTSLTSATSQWIEASLASREPHLVQLAKQQLKNALPLMIAEPLDYASLWLIYWRWQAFLKLGS